MIRVILVRHATARSDSGAGDKARPLTDYGCEQAGALGSRLRQNFQWDIALASSATRARQTAEIIVASRPTPIFSDELYAASAGEALEFICAHATNFSHDDAAATAADAPQTVLVVGHEPWVSSLAWIVSGGGGEYAGRIRCGMSTGSAAVIECDSWEDFAPGGGRVVALF